MSDDKKFNLFMLIVFLISVGFAIVIAMALRDTVKYTQEKGLKNILNETWEGKQ